MASGFDPAAILKELRAKSSMPATPHGWYESTPSGSGAYGSATGFGNASAAVGAGIARPAFPSTELRSDHQSIPTAHLNLRSVVPPAASVIPPTESPSPPPRQLARNPSHGHEMMQNMPARVADYSLAAELRHRLEDCLVENQDLKSRIESKEETERSLQRDVRELQDEVTELKTQLLSRNSALDEFHALLRNGWDDMSRNVLEDEASAVELADILDTENFSNSAIDEGIKLRLSTLFQVVDVLTSRRDHLKADLAERHTVEAKSLTEQPSQPLDTLAEDDMQDDLEQWLIDNHFVGGARGEAPGSRHAKESRAPAPKQRESRRPVLKVSLAGPSKPPSRSTGLKKSPKWR